MDQLHLQAFLQPSLEQMKQPWKADLLRHIAQQQLPAEVAGAHRWLLEGDMRLTWLRWFIEDYVDIGGVRKSIKADSVERVGFADIFSIVFERLLEEDRTSSRPDIKDTAMIISRLALLLLDRSGPLASRTIPENIKYRLATQSPDGPRCALCGFKFQEESVDWFMGLLRTKPEYAVRLVDVVRPRGLSSSDFEIQVDHIVPVSRGGETRLSNLQLACGWCNSSKNDYTYMYDASFFSHDSVEVKDLGLFRRPRRFWVVRMTSLIGKCEDRSGCHATLADSELFLAPRRSAQVLNPVSAKVFCRRHDPWYKARLIDRAVIAAERPLTS